MRIFFTSAILVLSLLRPAASADSTLLDGYTWRNRLLLVFSPDTDHPEFIAQNRIFAAVQSELQDRNLLVLRMIPDEPIKIDNKTSVGSSSKTIYRNFSIELEDFRVLLIGKDGTLKLTQTRAVKSSELFNLVDAMPMRRMEMQSKDVFGNQD